jgi:thymidylate synthase
MEIRVRNINEALPEGIWNLKSTGVMEASRNGPVLVHPEPVLTYFDRPEERVLFNRRRDANHIFHLVEAIWMLGGGLYVESILPFNSNYIQYAEEDGAVHGAYGARWRSHFGMDQIVGIVEDFRADPTSRRAVMQMWSAANDLGARKRDVPCNTGIYFDLRGGVLNMTVTNRSNDILWGAYGANVVHMSMLQELIARALGVKLGRYIQFSNNFHLYTNNERAQEFLAAPPTVNDLYLTGEAVPLPMLRGGEDYEDFLEDCVRFVENRQSPMHTEFMRSVVQPLAQAYIDRKVGLKNWRTALGPVPSQCDWLVGFEDWVQRHGEVPNVSK